MKKFFHDYFSFTKGEQRGLLILMLLIFLVFILPYTLRIIKGDQIYDISEFEDKLEAFEKALAYDQPKQVEYFSFNPNDLSFDGFLKLGLSKKQAYNIINYRKAGGVFKKPSDIAKIYSIQDSLYLILKPYINIPSSKNSEPKQAYSKVNKTYGKKDDEPVKTKKYNPENIKKELPIIELNSADSLLLIKLKGIGPVFAYRILSYRNILGGFYSINQLKEVYGLKSETFNKISPFITVDTTLIHTINLNTASFKQINKHPYVSFNQTKALLNYRDLMGTFSKVDDIISNHLIDSLNYNKVKPYLLAN